MIELLTRLNQKSSQALADSVKRPPKRTADEQAHADNMARLARKKACPACRGRRGVKSLGKWTWCQRCSGSGKLSEVSNKQTIVSKPSNTLSPDTIAALLAGMPSHWLLAAKVKVLGDEPSVPPLSVEVHNRIVLPESTNWRLSDDDRQKRIRGITKLAVAQLMIVGENQTITNEIGATALGVDRRNWQRRWSGVHREAAGKLDGWVKSADNYMMDRWHDRGGDEAHKNQN